MEKHKEPGYAAGQELTLHPGDPVRGAELLEENTREQDATQEDAPAVNRREVGRTH